MLVGTSCLTSYILQEPGLRKLSVGDAPLWGAGAGGCFPPARWLWDQWLGASCVGTWWPPPPPSAG